MIRLRPYRPSDAAVILSWCTDEQAFYKWTAGVLGDYPLSTEQFSQVQDKMAFTAEDDGAIVGFFIMRHPGESLDLLRFGFVTVDSRRRGQGCGKAMLRLGLKFAKEIYGAKKVTLGVFENNPSAYHCYRAVGFTELPTTESETYRIGSEEWRCLEMECVL